MTMDISIPDFTEAEQKPVFAILFERCGKVVPMQKADSDFQLDELSDELTLCPTIYILAERGVQFAVCAKWRQSVTAASSSIPKQSNTGPAMNNMTALGAAS